MKSGFEKSHRGASPILNNPDERRFAKVIVDYWESRGYSVKVWLEFKDDKDYPLWIVRTDLVNGLPKALRTDLVSGQPKALMKRIRAWRRNEGLRNHPYEVAIRTRVSA